LAVALEELEIASTISSIAVYPLEDPSTASLTQDIVVSMLQLLVSGLAVSQLDALLFSKLPGVLGVDGLIELDEMFRGFSAA
jgi:hypothetical protein